MKIAKKGTYGYRRWHQTRLMLSAVLLGGLMYYLFTLSLRVSKLPSTILTIGIVLSVVPLSLFVVMSFIASRAKTPSAERYAYAKQFEDRGIMLYDCIFMTDKTGFPVDFMLITNGKCYVQSCGDAKQQAELKKYLDHYMTVDHIGFPIVLGYGDKGFFDSIENLPRFNIDALSKEQKEKVLKCRRTLLGLSF